MAFTDIKIVGMAEKTTRSAGPHSALVNITLHLSAAAPVVWAEYFNAAWRQHIYMMKRNAEVSGSILSIECVPGELEHEHLPELQKVIAETNRTYAVHAAALERHRNAQASRDAATGAELQAIKKRIKFE